MKVGDKVIVNQQLRNLWFRLLGATGTVKIIAPGHIQVEVVIDGRAGRYNFSRDELVELKPLKLKQFSAWK